MNLCCLCTAVVSMLPSVVQAAPTNENTASITLPPQASFLETLAAREIHRYAYVRTGKLLPVVTANEPDARGMQGFIVGRKDRAIIRSIAADAGLETRLGGLAAQQYLIKAMDKDGRRLVLIAGGDELGTLYGGYRFAHRLGVRFYLHGDVVPDNKAADWYLPDLDEVGKPLFELRGIQPFHDFPEGPDWWDTDDYKAYISQLPKLRMNFIGLHTYPESNVGPEPTVWIGLAQDAKEDGEVTFSYPATYANTLRDGKWGYAPMKTGEFAAGASMLFEKDVYGPEPIRGHEPFGKSDKCMNDVFNRTGRMLGEAFTCAHQLGVKTCVGTETPLIVPQRVRDRLQSLGKDPKDQAVVRELYEGMFRRIVKAYPLDYYWLWTSERWTWQRPKPDDVEAVERDMLLALDALKNIGSPFGLATCGWVLGPPDDRSGWDRLLPKSAAVACINRQVGFSPVEPGFAQIEGRPQWAIPWMEDDPALIIPQLWVGRMRRDAADALAYGCTGLLGIHWRTRVLGPNVAALADAAWEQVGWNPYWGQEIKLPEAPASEKVVGGKTASFPDHAIADTDDDPVYQTVRYNLVAYYVDVPKGTCNVTLKFCEPHYREAGKRVFAVRIQGRPVIDKLDVFAKVGKDRALDRTIKDITVDDGRLLIEFLPNVEFPCVAGIVIDGTTTPSDQAKGKAFARRINCGGPAYVGYEADLPVQEGRDPFPDRPRDLPAGDFYADWAASQFGPEAAERIARIFTALDGGGTADGGKRTATLPRPSNWGKGPGNISVNRTPWQQEQKRYAFVDQLAALRPEIKGQGNLERFNYWLNSFRYLRVVGQLGCTRGKLNAIMNKIGKETDADRKKQLTDAEALPVRTELARLWERMMTLQLAVVSTPGGIGTVANLEQHVRQNNKFLGAHDETLAAALGRQLPEDVHPRVEYAGSPRVFLATIRPAVAQGESLNLRITVLSAEPVGKVSLFWRVLGKGEYAEVSGSHVARGVYRLTVPPARGLAMEYHVKVVTTNGEELFWPATAPGMSQTLVVLPKDTDG